MLSVLAIILFLWRGCTFKDIFNTGQKVIDTDTVIVTNTIVDRVAMENYKDSITTWYHQNPIEVSLYKVIKNPDTPSSNIDLSDTSVFHSITEEDMVYIYKREDSLLKANIFITSYCQPINVRFEYDVANTTIKDSTFVKDSATTTIEKTVTQKVRVTQVYLGPEAIVYPNFKGGFLTADLISSNGWQLEVGGGYGGNNGDISPMVKIGFKKVISFRRKK